MQLSQRVLEAEQLVQEYEGIGAADCINQMEIAFNIYSEDLIRINNLLKESDILREDHIVSVLGHYLLKQYAETQKPLQE